MRLYPSIPQKKYGAMSYLLGRRHPDQAKSGVLLEVVHYTTDFLNRTFDAVLQQYNPEPLKQNLIAGIVQGMPLYHIDLVQHWKERAAIYPDGLAIAVVNSVYADPIIFWRWEMWLARSTNLMQLYHSYAQVQQQLLHMLLGLNRVYYFGFKWLDVVAEQLRYKPDELVRRLSQVYQVAPDESARARLAALVRKPTH